MQGGPPGLAHVPRRPPRSFTNLFALGVHLGPWDVRETSSILKISPVRVVTYAVSPMNSREVGWSRPVVIGVMVPSRLTRSRAPVLGSAGEPSAPPGVKWPWDRAYKRP